MASTGSSSFKLLAALAALGAVGLALFIAFAAEPGSSGGTAAQPKTELRTANGSSDGEPRTSAPAAAMAKGVRLATEIYLSAVAPEITGAADRTGRRAVAGAGRTASLSGRTFDERGAVDRVEVKFLEGLNAGAKTVTDAEGKYEFAALYPGAGILEFDSATHGRARRDITLRRGIMQTFDLPLLAQGLVHGTVLSAGKPLVGARVEIDGFVKETDNDGGFFFSGVVPGDVILYLSAPKHEIRRDSIHLRPGQALEFDRNRFILRASEPLRVTFTHLPLSPEPPKVLFLPSDPPIDRSFPFERICVVAPRPGDDHVVVEGIPNGMSFQVRAFSESGICDPAGGWPLHPREGDTTNTNARFSFGWKAAVSGRVTANGKPAAGARVRVESSDLAAASEWVLREAGGLERIPAPVLPCARKELAADDQGRFRIETADVPRPACVVVAAPGFDPLVLGFPDAGGDLGELSLTPEPPAGDAKLTLEFGKRAPRAVRLFVNGNPQPERMLAEGEPFELGAIAPGYYSLRVREEGVSVLDRPSLRLRGDVAVSIPP